MTEERIMKRILFTLIMSCISTSVFALDFNLSNKQDSNLLVEYLQADHLQRAQNFSSEELEKANQMMDEILEKRNYCCRGTRGPSMRCATPIRFRCKRKPNCYWNC